jgi:hypothetical protein
MAFRVDSLVDEANGTLPLRWGFVAVANGEFSTELGRVLIDTEYAEIIDWGPAQIRFKPRHNGNLVDGTYPVHFDNVIGPHQLLTSDLQSAAQVQSGAVGHEHDIATTDLQSAAQVQSGAVGHEHDIAAGDLQSAAQVQSGVIGIVQDHDLATTDLQSAAQVQSGAVDHPSAGYSEDAQAVIDLMDSVSTPEMDAIAAFVDSQVTSGNWAKIDEFFCLALNSTVDDWLTGWKGLSIATNNGATHGANGASFTSGQYIDSGLHRSNTAQMFADLPNQLMGVYCHSFDYTGTGISYLCGNYAVRGTYLCHPGSGTQEIQGVATNSNTSLVAFARNQADVGGHFYAIDGNANDPLLFMDGVSQTRTKTTTTSTAPFNDTTFYIGTRNQNGTANTVYDKTITSFVVGTAAGFDHANFYTHLMTLHAALGVS